MDPSQEVWLFDVDGCIIDSLTGTSMRPGTELLLAHLNEKGHRVLVWSAGGDEYALRRAQEHGVDHLFHGFHGKESRNADGHYEVDHFLDPSQEIVFVDDRPEDLPGTRTVLPVPPYIYDNPHDSGLRRRVFPHAGLADAG